MEEKLKILVVDAGAVCCGLMAAGARVEVSETADSKKAIAVLQQQPFDCVFLNYRLSDGDGLTLVRQVRSLGLKVPLIVLTHEEDEEIAMELMKAGASDYIDFEQVSAQTLVRIMNNAIRIYRAETLAAIAFNQIQESEERYRLVLEGSNDGIWDWDITKNQVYCNHRIEEIIGQSVTELGKSANDFNTIVKKFFDLLHPEDRKKLKDAVRAHLCHNAEFNLELRLRHSSGEYRYCMMRGKAQRDAFGKPVRMAGALGDITAAKQVEEELRSRLEQLEKIHQINARLYLDSQEASNNLRRAVLILGEQQQQLRTLQRLSNLINQHLANLPELLQVMAQSVCDAIAAAQFCFIVLNNQTCVGEAATQENCMVLTVTAGIGTERLRLDEDGWLKQVVSTVGDFKSARKEMLNTQCPMLRAYLPASVCTVAINSPQGGCLGVLGIGNWEDGEAFDEEDRHLLVAVGEQAAIAINNARLIKTLEEREERLANQNEVLANQNRELENQRQQIQMQNLQLMEAARLKSQFLATMSHELRTPMNAVIGFSQLLLHSSSRSRTQSKGQPLTLEQENMVQRILDNGKHLLSLIDDILDLSKIESGRLELLPEPVNLEVLLTNAVEEFRSPAQEKHLDLNLDIGLNNPIAINDSIRLRQIIVNLLSNAVKFTPSGFVRVEVSEPSPDKIAIVVQDSGIGIAQENLDRIFETFRQVDQSLSKKYYGTGLGLAIIKSLVQMMNGKITVQSVLGEGSTFTIEIPREVPLSAGRKTKTTKRIIR
ncbi:ATP-binding protein [Microseira sp. BLCC-F43]|jgi:PAS domain S-box-containing protein|uniref:hybrid sensor histidine kinase/response regulator n=1 Tax=Microseira sp. BLCC-F43 TaxID=3153602 RepID=UPI0035BA6FCC